MTRWQVDNFARRGVLRMAGAPVLAATIGAAPFLRLGAQTLDGQDPFTLGVASGCPTPDGVVLWTRLAPRPLQPDGGMGTAPVEVTWELAVDEGFGQVLRSGRIHAVAEEAHSVRVELRGLAPERDYWFRFTAAGARSPVGRTRTAPHPSDTRPVRFAFCSCQQYEQGFYSAYRDMAAQKLDLVVHLGDYIYESSWGHQHVRQHHGGVPMDLPEFRIRHALYKTDPDLQEAHAAFPWLVAWDDHEVANDYTGASALQHTDAAWFGAMRAAAYRAWWEHMPVPRRMQPVGAQARIYGHWRFGAMLDLMLLDGRQYRDPHVCLFGSRASPPVDCPERTDPLRSLLGAEQERWLQRELARPGARWTVLAQPTLMAPVDRAHEGEEPAYWMDGWDGYAATRQRVLAALHTHRHGQGIVIGGDVHAFWAADLRRAPDGPVIATEFVGGSISSQGPSASTVRRLQAQNPDLRYGRGDRRGYAMMTLTHGSAHAQFRAVSDARRRDATAAVLARFDIEAGRPGVQGGLRGPPPLIG